MSIIKSAEETRVKVHEIAFLIQITSKPLIFETEKTSTARGWAEFIILKEIIKFLL